MMLLTFLPYRKEEEEQAVGAIYCKNIEELLQQSDFVMLVVNLTPQTHKLIGKRELGLMKPTATLINISRGRVCVCSLVSFHSFNSWCFQKPNFTFLQIPLLLVSV